MARALGCRIRLAEKVEEAGVTPLSPLTRNVETYKKEESGRGVKGGVIRRSEWFTYQTLDITYLPIFVSRKVCSIEVSGSLFDHAES